MIRLHHCLGSNCFVTPGGRAEGKETDLSSDFNDRFQREPFLKDNFVVAGIPVPSGNADLTASGTPLCSAVQVQCVSWRE